MYSRHTQKTFLQQVFVMFQKLQYKFVQDTMADKTVSHSCLQAQ